MINNKPFFSILIPTYKRSGSLFVALKSILSQDFNDFEVIISDNDPASFNKKIIDSLNDKRLRYYKNSKNIGACKNQSRIVEYAKGKYLIFHSDDDLLIRNDALRKVWEKLKEKEYGLLRMHFLNRTPNNKKFFFCNPKLTKDFKINPGAPTEKILKFCDDISLNFITGIVVRADFSKSVKMTHAEMAAWFNICFYNIKKYGGYFLSDYFFLCRWSIAGLKYTYQLDNGMIPSELHFKDVFEKVKFKDIGIQLDKYLMSLITVFPAAKYFTDNKNLIALAKRIIALSPNYRYSIIFWYYLFLGIISPKLLLHWYRFYRINNIKVDYKIKNINNTKKKLSELKEEIIKNKLIDAYWKDDLIGFLS